MRLFQRLGTAVAVTAAALATMLSASTTAQADAVSASQGTTAAACSEWAPGHQPTSVRMTTTKSIKLRWGPAADCDFIGFWDMPVPTTLKAICKYRNPAGNIWYYVQPVNTDWDPGWIYSGNVTIGSGTIRNC